MNLRDYQEEFCAATLRDLMEFDRVLGVMATGGGKTICAAEICKRNLDIGPILFLADATELVTQAANKIANYTQEFTGVEMSKQHAEKGDRIVVATTQTIARRLHKWDRDYFSLIIIDEAHRNTLGQQAQGVLGHFKNAQVIGITATPFRSDKKKLSSFYETISCEIDLVRLIKAGYLSRITVKQVPMTINLRDVGVKGGDYDPGDLGVAIMPHLREAAKLLKEHALKRRTVVFVPLIETSKAFVDACNEIGLRACHVDGTDKTNLSRFAAKEFDIISNASLLSTGWDEPSVDCVMILRPTKSHSLYSQMVGRGTRICPGKDDLLLLDPLYLAEKVDLIRPARLLSSSEDEEKSIQARLDMGEEDLLEVEEKAEIDRYKALEERIREVAKRKSKTVDALEFALSIGGEDLANYEPTMLWEAKPMTDAQREQLTKRGLDIEAIKNKGHASKILDLLFMRQDKGLASPKQVKWLIKFKHPKPYLATFEEASEFLDSKFNKKKSA